MSSAKITLFTFAKYMQQHDDDLFSNLLLPSGLSRDTLVENILLRGGEFEVIYSDPVFMQYAIGTWSKKWYRTMDKWLQALAIDYNPLENYDRYESIQDKSERNISTDRTLDNQDQNIINTQDLRTLDTDVLNTRNLQDKETKDLQDVTTYDHDTEVEEQVSAYDSSSYQPSKVTYNKDSDSDHNTVRLDQDGTDTFNHTGYDDTKNTGTDRMNRTGTETAFHTGSINDESDENGFNDHAGHIHGNIGVTSSQDLLSQELSINEWNIYEHITDLFLTEFVIPIYT